MTLHPLPRPATTAECYLAAVVDRLDRLAAAVEELSGRLGPATQPPPEQQDEGGRVRLLEPDAPEPPRHGKGSSRDAWAAYADRLGVPYPPEAGQKAIIAAVDAHRRAA